MEKKTYRGRLQLKAEGDGPPGSFRAEFATLNVIDHDQDVTVPGAFHAGQEVVIEPWNHQWTLPVGKGAIHEEDDKAVIEGQFFLDTQGGQEHYIVVKELGPLQEWSYTFNIEDSGQGKFGDPEQDVRFLRDLDVWGVAPVTRGAGIDTRTTDIKGLKPYPGEHACRLRSPDAFQADTFVRTTREHEGKEYSVIQGKLTGEDTLTDQAFRYPRETWDVEQARAHCEGHDGISFEPAEGEASACPVCAAAKVGARHTAKEVEQIQAIHDHAVALGAKCAEADDADTGDDQDEASDGKSRSPSLVRAQIEIEQLDTEVSL